MLLHILRQYLQLRPRHQLHVYKPTRRYVQKLVLFYTYVVCASKEKIFVNLTRSCVLEGFIIKLYLLMVDYFVRDIIPPYKESGYDPDKWT